MKLNGKLIVIEGTDGSGKTTQLEILSKTLTEQGYDVLTMHLPSYESVGKFFREEAIGENETKHNPLTEALLILADLADITVKSIKPHLAKGGVVLCSRWILTTLAYQANRITAPDAVDNKLIFDMILRMDRVIDNSYIHNPDIKIVLLSDETYDERLERRSSLDAMELKDDKFKQAVTQVYKESYQTYGYKYVCAKQSIETVASKIMETIEWETQVWQR